MKASFQAGRRLSLRAGVVALVTVVGAGAALAGCGGSSDTSGGSSDGSSSGGKVDTQLALVGYSTPKKAYAALTSAFSQTTAGKGVGFSQSFGASGSQSRAVDSGVGLKIHLAPDGRDGDAIGRPWPGAGREARPHAPAVAGTIRGCAAPS